MQASWHLGFVVVAFFLTSDVGAAGPKHWTYDGEHGVDKWAEDFEKCAGAKQSPIDLNPATATSANFHPLYFGNYHVSDSNMRITNNGHSALLSLPKSYPETKLPYIKDGGLHSKFILAQIHFHWGSDDSKGSEHTLKSKRYAAEIHFVHYNKKYVTFPNSTMHPDGLAVVGVFVAVGEEDNKGFEPIAAALEHVMKTSDESLLKTPTTLMDLLPASRSKFYRYSGSLTTPGCQEIVTWTVFDSPIVVSHMQLAKFRKLMTDDGKPMVDNYRPVQKLGERTVYVRSSASSFGISSILVVLMPLFAPVNP